MFRRLAPAAALLLLASTPALAQVEKKDVAGIVNYSRVDASVGCGGATDPSAMAALKAEGFRAVLNLRLPGEDGAAVTAGREAAEAVGLKYIHIPFNETRANDVVVDQFLRAVTDPANQPVYIHCDSGNRVAGLWMIKRALLDGWDLDRAAAEADAIGLTSDSLYDFVVAYITRRR